MGQKFNNKNDVFVFGKYKGQTLQSVYTTDKDYISWCLREISDFILSPDLQTEFNYRASEDDENSVKANFEYSLTKTCYDLFDLKLKADILEQAYRLVLDEDPRKNYKSEYDYLDGLHIYNVWNTKCSLSEKMKEDALSKLCEEKKKLISLLSNKINKENNIEYDIADPDPTGGGVLIEIKIAVHNSEDQCTYPVNIAFSGNLYYEFVV